jgi:hypothetical protein
MNTRLIASPRTQASTAEWRVEGTIGLIVRRRAPDHATEGVSQWLICSISVPPRRLEVSQEKLAYHAT